MFDAYKRFFRFAGEQKGTWYKGMAFELLRSIRKLKAQVPHLVLHGGSGLQDKVVRSAIQEGVRKINVATEIRLAYLEGLRATMDSRDIYTYISVARSFVMNVAKAKIQLFTAEEN